MNSCSKVGTKSLFQSWNRNLVFQSWNMITDL